ncbi:MAG: preprotein translocase subunit SecA [Planctomycetes bacterium]|nr:preprotein translocase subunit SecA [Planctomycetota bacterium]
MASIGDLLKGVFGSRNDRIVREILPVVARVNALEPRFEALSDEKLRATTPALRARLAAGETLDDLLPEAFAACREAAKRTIGLRHFDVQLIGGAVLHQGKIGEMVTGEGKTLVATSAVYLNALAGPVHVVTVNDYLAKRDAEWMRPVYEALGVSVGAIQAWMMSRDRIPIYRGDIVYGTNSEFGFDYLRDNMKVSLEDQCQRELRYAVVDEVDSILIDEARTPLIISGPADEDQGLYEEADRIARRLKKGEDFEVKEKEHQCTLTDEGYEKAERLAGVSFFEGGVTDWPHLVETALRAHNIYQRDVDYVAMDGEIVIVDEFTGRLMQGRRWSDGLHQAVEAKEGIKPREENQTLATITYQNFFKLYKKLSGMTGTALTEAAEFWKIYHLDVVSIPTNRPLIRTTADDRIYRTEKEKFNAVVDEIVTVHKTGRPILVGTTSIEKSERVSSLLQRRGVAHAVLNAKQHEREASIVAEAGQDGKVTIATNMAGRGTDILLGPGISAKGGLHIVGTERHESRRIDNQLRGRAGRQGDPGSSQFFLSLEDDLMRKFAPEWVARFLGRLGLADGEEISHPMVTKAITRAQKKVEAYNFEIRKNLLEYDEVMDLQRKEVYGLRQSILAGDEARQREVVERMIRRVVADHADLLLGRDVDARERNPAELATWFRRHFGMDASDTDAGPTAADAKEKLAKIALERWARRAEELGAEDLRRLERFLLLNSIDAKWKDHLRAMDGLKTGIGLRGYGQLDPKVEYKVEGHRMFSEMIQSIREEVTDLLFKVRLRTEDEQQLESRWGGADDAPPTPPPAAPPPVAPPRPAAPPPAPPRPAAAPAGGAPMRSAPPPPSAFRDARAGAPVGSAPQAQGPIRRDIPKVGRNDPCPCGSGKKYKKCHGEDE